MGITRILNFPLNSESYFMLPDIINVNRDMLIVRNKLLREG